MVLYIFLFFMAAELSLILGNDWVVSRYLLKTLDFPVVLFIWTSSLPFPYTITSTSDLYSRTDLCNWDSPWHVHRANSFLFSLYSIDREEVPQWQILPRTVWLQNSLSWECFLYHYNLNHSSLDSIVTSDISSIYNSYFHKRNLLSWVALKTFICRGGEVE